VTLALSSIPKPIITYKPISEHFSQLWNSTPSQQEIATVIETIRRSKLPKPELLGNCGSFFQNPIVTSFQVEKLLIEYPTIPHYALHTTSEKLSAAWLIEQSWLKWYRQWVVGTYEKQPLVIVNYWWWNGKGIKDLSDYIIDQVEKKFWIFLQREVNIW
jgi:UDP-N-acetylmuramate dehydrogenase